MTRPIPPDPAFGRGSLFLSEGVDLPSEYTVEIGVTLHGRITDVRVTRGYARYGRPAWWRRWLSRWFPWLLIHFHRPSAPFPHQGPTP